jgi:hypothetical protein
MTINRIIFFGLFFAAFCLIKGQRQIPSSFSNPFLQQKPNLQPIQLQAQQRPAFQVLPSSSRRLPPRILNRRPVPRSSLQRRSLSSFERIFRAGAGISNRKPARITLDPQTNLSNEKISDNRSPLQLRTQGNADFSRISTTLPPPQRALAPPRQLPQTEVTPSRNPVRSSSSTALRKPSPQVLAPPRRAPSPPPPQQRQQTPPQRQTQSSQRSSFQQPPPPRFPTQQPQQSQSQSRFQTQRTSAQIQPGTRPPMQPQPPPQRPSTQPQQFPQRTSIQQQQQQQAMLRPPVSPTLMTPRMPPTSQISQFNPMQRSQMQQFQPRPPPPMQPPQMQPRLKPSPPPAFPSIRPHITPEQRFTRPEQARVLPPSAPIGPPRPTAPFTTNNIDDPVIASPISRVRPSIHPPGFLPPSNSVVDELNHSENFLEVARRLQLRRVTRH